MLNRHAALQRKEMEIATLLPMENPLGNAQRLLESLWGNFEGY
jgi:hypothetical protein